MLDDYNGPSQEGVGVFQQSAADGLRYSSSVAYLDDPLPSLYVETGATVSRVVIENGRATGVEYLTEEGRRTIHADREVVLSAGVFGSAQILMLSGVGPADHVRGHGIHVHADLPVGDNLHDHLFVPMTYVTKDAVHRGTAPHFASGVAREYTRGNSWVARTVFEAAGFVRSSQADDIPDLQIHALPWSYPFPNQDAPTRHKVDKRPALTIMPTLIYPHSRGSVRLASNDPLQHPLIDPAYLSEKADSDLLLEGVALIREVMAHSSIKGGIDLELSPGADYFDDAAMAAELPNRATTVYHPVGTCRMGVDERAVVDPELRVLGIDGLRVADTAVMPSITGGNTNAPAMMIGERCAELMLRDASFLGSSHKSWRADVAVPRRRRGRGDRGSPRDRARDRASAERGGSAGRHRRPRPGPRPRRRGLRRWRHRRVAARRHRPRRFHGLPRRGGVPARPARRAGQQRRASCRSTASRTSRSTPRRPRSR